jgi:hypothetical protein
MCALPRLNANLTFSMAYGSYALSMQYLGSLPDKTLQAYEIKLKIKSPG